MWLLVIVIILILYIIIVSVSFSRVRKTTTFNYSLSPPPLADLPFIDQYETCYDAFGNAQFNIWYDISSDRTYTTNIIGSTGEVIAKSGSQYVYLLANGRLSCFPLSA
jgi:hypothetical protein